MGHKHLISQENTGEGSTTMHIGKQNSGGMREQGMPSPGANAGTLAWTGQNLSSDCL